MEKDTYFAPAARSSVEEILNEKLLVESQKFFTELLGSLTGVSAIIDNNRQIVYANNEFLELLGLDSLDPILGKRPGEAVACINSHKNSAGCGTDTTCRYCGAVNAILESQNTQTKASKEARISSLIEGKLVSLDLKITSSPIVLKDKTFYALTLQDISGEKRLQTIERVFFHDLLNAAGGLNGLLSVLKMGTNPNETTNLIEKSEEASQFILEEIMSYRQMKAAEEGDVNVNIETFNTIEFLKTAINRIEFHSVGVNKRVKLDVDSADIDFQTDRLLFQRVLINILKNALEATEENEVVTVAVKEEGDKLCFSIKNPGVMPEYVQLQVFQRSFSTKGYSRGIGTYSVKLITENFLKGKVYFVSNETEGTVFFVELDKQSASNNQDENTIRQF